MTTKLVVSAVVVFYVAALLGPPDPMSQLTLGIGGGLLCAIPLMILARRKFMRVASNSVHTLVCILVSLVTLLSIQCYVMWRGIERHRSHARTLQTCPVEADASPSTAVRLRRVDNPLE